MVVVRQVGLFAADRADAANPLCVGSIYTNSTKYLRSVDFLWIFNHPWVTGCSAVNQHHEITFFHLRAGHFDIPGACPAERHHRRENAYKFLYSGVHK